jgi:hypothetical protein
VINSLAIALKEEPDVRIGRMDMTKNDVPHPMVHVRGFPSFYFFPAGSRDDPIEYDGERSVPAILRFIQVERSIEINSTMSPSS